VNGRTHVLAFWEYAAFLANSVVFVLIGTQEATHAGRFLHLATVAAIALVLLGRAAAVYPISALFRRSGLRVSTFGQHVMFWGGLRGALALALALATPPALEERDQIIAVTFGVVAFSVFAQGLTIPHLIRSQKSRAES
jgi:CPA1 family monovalent cation:H+ antiporter